MELRLPELGDNVSQATVVGVLVREGDTVREGQPVLELETDKAVVEVPAEAGGVVAKVLVRPGDEVRPGQPILVLAPAEGQTPAGPSPKEAKEAWAETQGEPEPQAPGAQVGIPGLSEKPLIPASPAVRRLARELGVDLAQVRGSGLAGRITPEDVRRAAEGFLSARPSPLSQGILPLPDLSRFGPVRREPMSGVRRATLRAMAQAWAQVPMVTHFDEADITGLEDLRKRYAEKAQAQGFRLTLTPFLLKALALTLRAFPKFNASVDVEKQEIVYKEYIHIGVAVDTPHGLLVPVVRDVDKKGIFALAQELQTLSERARERKLTPEEMQGASFSLSNLGGIGGTGFTPIVNWPEVAILGVSRSRIQPVWDPEGEAFLPRLILPFSLTYDHRLIDGAEAARFCRHLAGLLEDPVGLALA